MPNPRRYTDDQLREAVAASISWADVSRFLGRGGTGGAPLKKVATSLGLDTSHFDPRRSMTQLTAPTSTFSKEPSHNGGRSGVSIAARWFLDRGYNVSLPMEVALYDLVAESDKGLQRVQIKTSDKLSRADGVFTVRIMRKIYDSSIRNALGACRFVPYERGEIDIFFIATSAGSNYIIPLSAVAGMSGLSLGKKYEQFRV